MDPNEVLTLTAGEIVALLATRNPFMTRREACRVLGVTAPTLIRLERDGDLSRTYRGRRICYPRQQVESLAALRNA